MKWLSKLRRSIRNWLTPSLAASPVDNLPDTLEPRVLYLVGDETPWQAAMLCPCGCDAPIQLSLIPNDRPGWSYRLDGEGRVSLHPSVWRTSGCRAHFVVARNRIYWY
jgi:hypothetical protein